MTTALDDHHTALVSETRTSRRRAARHELRGVLVAPSSSAHRLLLAAGLLGSVFFTASYLLDGVLRPGYDPLRQPISALSLGPGGWVQITSFIVFGALSCCSAVGWRATMSGGLGVSWYPRLKLLAGVALIIAGIFSQDPGLGFPHGVPSPVHPTLHAQIHNVATFVSLTATVAGFLVLARRFTDEPRWRGWATSATLTAAAMVVFLAAFGGAMNDGGPGGLFEKLATIAALLFNVALVARLLRHDACISTSEANS
jgi:hypothetical protein